MKNDARRSSIGRRRCRRLFQLFMVAYICSGGDFLAFCYWCYLMPTKYTLLPTVIINIIIVVLLS